jgi:hypothetical protein
MSDNLRDRIAAAIYQTVRAWDDFPYEELPDHAKGLYRVQADAVIAALGLREEGEDDVHCTVCENSINPPGAHRYVTDWYAND